MFTSSALFLGVRRRFSWPGFLACIIALIALAVEISTTVPFEVDDAYITFSFSKNLAAGHGPVYSHGMRVEGYSNFLWMLLVAIPLVPLPEVDPTLLARFMAVPFAAGLVVSVYLLARIHASRLWAFFAAMLVACNVDVALAFLSGLESLPYTALATIGFLLYLRSGREENLRRYVVPVFVLVALTRIDGFVPLGFVVGYELVSACVDRRFSLPRYVRWALPGVLVWCVWFAWRYAYYGLPLPSTYYAKALIPELLPRRGVEYVFDELSSSALYLAVPSVALLFWRRRRDAVPLAIFALGQIVYAARVGGDWMPHGRFVLPAVPLLIVLLVWGAHSLVCEVERNSLVRVLAWVPGLVAVAIVFTRGEHHVSSVDRVALKIRLAAEQIRHVKRLKKAAGFLDVAVPPGGRLVSDYGGVLAYYTDATVIEMWGLSNATIAVRGGTTGINPIYGKTCPECYPELEPEYFHVAQPLIRSKDAFGHHLQVVRSVWQTDTIGRYMDIVHGFASGRVVRRGSGSAAWFLEKRTPGWVPRPRRDDEYIVEYPFDVGGRMPGA